MIERYSISTKAEDLKKRFSVDVPEYYQPRYNAAPTQLLPVITSSAPKGLSLFYWGTSPEWVKNKTASEKIINLRSDVLLEKPTLRKALNKNRCIIPADGFYAWKKIGKKTSVPYRFVLANREPFGIAGLWEEFEDTEGNEIHTFRMITTAAADIVRNVQDVMPLLVSKESEKKWLDAASAEQDVNEILSATTPGVLDYYPVSPAIANAERDVASLILPSPPADQFGNLTLFD